jgi:hypothetical protein
LPKQRSDRDAVHYFTAAKPQNERRTAMSEPYLDSYNISFHNLADMLDYHIRQAKDSVWERAEVNALRVVPLDETSEIYSDRTAFPKKVSEEAVADTAKNLGLAMLLDGLHIPLRDTAYKSLTDRAKVGGTALPKLKRSDLADTLNACFALHNDQALLLIRDEKVSAVHSGDEKDYSILPIDELLTSVKTKLDERFSGNIFESGYTDHSLTSAAWSLPDQKEDLLGAYSKTLQAQGKATSAAKLVPGIRFFTSDTGNASAKVAALLIGLQHPNCCRAALRRVFEEKRSGARLERQISNIVVPTLPRPANFRRRRARRHDNN